MEQGVAFAGPQIRWLGLSIAARWKLFVNLLVWGSESPNCKLCPKSTPYSVLI